VKIGIIGLQNSGKTTVFNALTGSQAQVTNYSTAKAEPNLATINVADERIDALSKMYNPKKTIYATIEVMDFVGVTKGSSQEGAFSGEYMRLIKTTDALAIVLRNFENEMGEAPNPVEDLGIIDEELLLSDLILVEKRLEKIEQGFKRGQKTPALAAEEKVLRKMHEVLNEMKPIHTMDLNEDEEKIVRGYQLLTQKPSVVIVNSSESNYGQNKEIIEHIEKAHSCIEFAGTFEMELSQLEDAEEKAMFMGDMGIEVSARDRLTRAAYEAMGYISFFTVGEDEVRAWNIVRNDTAIKAAGTIHTDLARGFIRAECFSYDALIDCGSEKGVKEKGQFRLEGKEYVVQDGDILNIRFNV